MQEGTAGQRPGRTGKQDSGQVPVQGVPLQGGQGSRTGQPADVSLEEASTRFLGEEQSMAGNWRQPALKQGSSTVPRSYRHLCPCTGSGEDTDTRGRFGTGRGELQP